MKNSTTIFLLLSMALLYSAIYPISNLLLYSSHINFMTSDLLWFRIIFASIAFNITWLVLKKNRDIISKKNSIRSNYNHYYLFLITALLMPVLSQWLLFEGIKYTSPVNSSMMRMLSPVFILLFAALFFKQERLTLTKVIGILIATAGSVWLILVSDKNSNSLHSSFYGDLLVLLSTIAFGLYAIISKKLIFEFGYHPVYVLRTSFTLGLIIMFFISFFSNKIPLPNLNLVFLINGKDLVLLLILLLGSTYIAFLIDVFVLRYRSASYVAVFSTLIPVFTAILSFFFLYESLSSTIIFPSFLAILGVLMIVSAKTFKSTISKLYMQVNNLIQYIYNNTFNKLQDRLNYQKSYSQKIDSTENGESVISSQSISNSKSKDLLPTT